MDLQAKLEARRQITDLETLIQKHKLGYYDAEDAGTVDEWKEYGRKLVKRLNTMRESFGWPKLAVPEQFKVARKRIVVRSRLNEMLYGTD